MALNINGTTGISGVEGSVSAPVLTGTDSNCGISFPAADTIKFSTGGVERMSITNSGISGITAGITEADQWRIPTTYSTSGDAVITSWERNDSNFEVIGSGMTESSGIFTFPSTGKYLIMASLNANASNAQYIGIVIKYTGDGGSSFTTRAQNFDSTGGSLHFASINAHTIFDVVDTSTHKVRFHSNVSASTTIEGVTTAQRSGFTFIKLGDT